MYLIVISISQENGQQQQFNQLIQQIHYIPRPTSHVLSNLTPARNLLNKSHVIVYWSLASGELLNVWKGFKLVQCLPLFQGFLREVYWNSSFIIAGPGIPVPCATVFVPVSASCCHMSVFSLLVDRTLPGRRVNQFLFS